MSQLVSIRATRLIRARIKFKAMFINQLPLDEIQMPLQL